MVVGVTVKVVVQDITVDRSSIADPDPHFSFHGPGRFNISATLSTGKALNFGRSAASGDRDAPR